MMAKKKAAKKTVKKTKAIQGKMLSKELRCFIIMPFSKAVFKDSDGTEKSLGQRKLKRWQRLAHAIRHLFPPTGRK